MPFCCRTSGTGLIFPFIHSPDIDLNFSHHHLKQEVTSWFNPNQAGLAAAALRPRQLKKFSLVSKYVDVEAEFLRGRERSTVAFRPVGNISAFARGRQTKWTWWNQTCKKKKGELFIWNPHQERPFCSRDTTKHHSSLIQRVLWDFQKKSSLACNYKNYKMWDQHRNPLKLTV